MMLSQIRQYLQQRGQVSLADIALHLDTPPEAVNGMLETLLRKGRVRRQLLNSACGSSCCQCDSAATALYEWVGSGSDDPLQQHPLSVPGQCPTQK
jgi:putative ferrous iron transport protein C